MAESKLNKALFTNINKLKLCNKSDAEVRFLLEKSPFPDDDDEMAAAAAPKSDEYLIIGRIFPKSNIYNQGSFQVEMKLTKNFPMEPPDIRFLTPIYHPNVNEKGEFCHELVKAVAQWKATTSLVDVVKAVVDRIDKPDLDYASSYTVGSEYTGNRAEFDRKALESVKQHALPRQ